MSKRVSNQKSDGLKAIKTIANKSYLLTLILAMSFTSCREDNGGGESSSPNQENENQQILTAGQPKGVKATVVQIDPVIQAGLFEAFSSVVNRLCTSCHNTAAIGDFASYKTAVSWMTSPYITPGSPNSSLLYLRLQNSGGNMPLAGAPLTEEELKAVEEFIGNPDMPSVDNKGGGEKGPRENFDHRAPDEETPAVNFSTFYSVISDSCLACHSTALNGNFALLDTEEAWVASPYLAVGDPENSPVYNRLKNAAGDMPKNSTTLSGAEASLIYDYINSLRGFQLTFYGQNPRLGTRFYIISVLKSIFGDSVFVDSKDVFKTYISENISVFGGPCDLHGSVRPRNRVPEYPEHDCHENANGSKEASIGPTSSPRAGWLINACEMLTGSDTALLYALNTPMGLSAPLSEPTITTIGQAYRLFYPERMIPVSIANLFLLTGANETSVLEKWRWVFLGLCMTAEWQVP